MASSFCFYVLFVVLFWSVCLLFERGKDMASGHWALDELEEWYAVKGGLIDCHRHIDRHNTLDEEGYGIIADNAPLEKKWEYIDRKKRSCEYTDTMEGRMQDAVHSMVSQGVKACRTYVDVDDIVGLAGLRAALVVKRGAALQGFFLQVAAYPIRGITEKAQRDLFLEAAEQADLIGTLPSRDRRDIGDAATVEKNMREYFDIAMRLKKPIDMQIDQKNTPLERESAILVDVARAYRDKGYAHGITATHCISLGAHALAEIKRTRQAFRELGISVVVCPGAAISTRQDRFQMAPIRNAIAPVEELLEGGVTVALGTDNVSDIFMPFCNGDLRAEMTKFADAIRWQGDLSRFADIATTNGRMTLGLPCASERE